MLRYTTRVEHISNMCDSLYQKYMHSVVSVFISNHRGGNKVANILQDSMSNQSEFWPPDICLDMISST